MSRIPTLCLAAAVAFALVGAGTAAAATGSPSPTTTTTTTTTTTQPGGATSTQAVTPPPSPGHVQSVSNPIADQYIVTLKDTAQSSVPGEAQQLAAKHGGAVFAVYQHALDGFAVRMSAAQAVAMSEEPTVASVEEDGVVRAATVEPPDPNDSPSTVGATGIDRIDQHSLPLDNMYHYDATGAGVHAYIIDTGIASVPDFGGRASFGADCTTETNPCQTSGSLSDCYGHGTHVAGILGGSEFGVAKDVSLVEVRVLGCNGEGDDSWVIAGVDWVTANAVYPAVANMSLGGGTDAALDSAIRNSEEQRSTGADGTTTSSGSKTTVTAADGSFSSADVGVKFTDSLGEFSSGTTVVSVQSSTQATVSGPAAHAVSDDVFTLGAGHVSYAVAAGNSSESACDSSPADAGGADSATMTAAASDPTNDTQASFSDFGSCADLYVPGVNITSDGTSPESSPYDICPGVTCTLSGTSMATPHVAGTAALYLQNHATATPATVKSIITADATPNVISNASAGTPNLLDYTGAGAPTLTVTPSAGADQLSWTMPQDIGSSISGYDIYRSTTSGGEQLLTSVPSTPLTYTDSSVKCGVTYFYEVAAVDVIGQTLSSEQSAAPCGSGYFPVAPTRILDTRTSIGGHQGALGPGGTLNLQVTGAGGDLIPTDATSVVLNVTATDETTLSYLTVYPTGTAPPLASNLNMVANTAVPNLVTVEIGTGGDVSFYNAAGSTDVIADVAGYFDDGTLSPESTYHPLTPVRVLDTRTATGGHQGALGPGGTLTLTPNELAISGGIPSGVQASAVVMNVTATDVTAIDYLTVYPAGATRPVVSNLNMYPGNTIANLVTVTVSAGGVTFYNAAGSSDVVADLAGYYTSDSTGHKFVAVPPSRVLDTRTSTGGHPGALGQAQTLNLVVAGHGGVPSSGAFAVVMNVTATDVTNLTFVTVYPAGMSLPLASNLDPPAGATVPNLSITALGTGGAVTFYNAIGSVDVIGDVSGYYE